MNQKRVSSRVKITKMTLFNLRKLAKMCGYGEDIGKVVDKLVREKCISMKEWEHNE